MVDTMIGPSDVAAPPPPTPAARPSGLRSLAPHVRAHRGSLAVVAGLSLASALLTLTQPLVTRSLLNALGDRAPIAGLVGLLLAVLGAVAVINSGRDYVMQRTAEGIVFGARRRLIDRLLRLPIAEYDRRRTGDLLSRVGTDTTLLRTVLTTGLLDAASDSVLVIGAIVAMVVLDPILFLTTCAGLSVGLGMAVLIARRLRPAAREAQARVGDLTSATERVLTAARTIRASNAQAAEIATVSGTAEAAYAAGLRMGRIRALVGPATFVAVQGAFILLLVAGGARVASGAIRIGDLLAFVMFLFFLVIPLTSMVHAYAALQMGFGALQRMDEILALPVEDDSSEQEATDAGITFDRVTFGYDAETVLDDVSFTVAAGTRTAVVGPSGAGKSTLLQLVERFYDVTGGAVLVGGVDVREQRRSDLRRSLGYVEQEAPVLAGTIRENLRLTVPDADEAQMRAVLASVNLSGVVDRSPLGLDAEVGEGGVLLSGGERQRLAIARTLLAEPPILLLDEATSNLDARNETALRQAIDTAGEGRTLLIVAHRLSTVVDADQIVVLEAGRVVAVGRHGELVETNALYRELAATQLLVAP
ncbi:ABC transporter ATP-binding protein [Cryptosporangium sp. NPDC051539]|uniref:ABC transporter ATP-binding protein n=1 Tax=Cryptosporangium sp. NPDC051539 TaxID=3363962 RepID=UPI0037B024EE